MGMRIEPNPIQGYGIYRVSSAASNNAAVIKDSPGVLGGWFIANTDAAALFVKLYDKAAAPAPASDTPKLTIQIPAGGYVSHPVSSLGMKFENGIAILIVTGAGDTDNTAVGAGDCLATIAYA